MSAVTLESLRADFEAAVDVIREPLIRDGAVFNDVAKHRLTPDGALEGFCEEAWIGFDEHIEARRMIREKAALYLIAREHGLNAAMLFKLSGGNMDPRQQDSCPIGDDYVEFRVGSGGHVPDIRWMVC